MSLTTSMSSNDFFFTLLLRYLYLHPGLQWQYQHTIDKTAEVNALHWVSNQHLAVCMKGRVMVYEVTAQSSHLAYQLSSDEWKGKDTRGVAISDSLPDNMLVIRERNPFVYQVPCHEAAQAVKKYRIHCNEVDPWHIVANINTAVIDINVNNTLVICSLPDFTKQSYLQIHHNPLDLSISTECVLIMSSQEMVMKPLRDITQDSCLIKSADDWELTSVCFRNDAKEIYAASYQGWDKGCVYRYKWDTDKSQYVNTGCVIDGLGSLWSRCLSLTSDGLLALCEYGNDVKVYSLE